ncbi:hyaluronan-binding protein 2-like [Eucyclogobius newberryi]|uniref:hyaluronan-binding protein 2-like n=1 Tax=Eucyclogobius newberryi TaxID=166745 RepID=UPI003B5BCB75
MKLRLLLLCVLLALFFVSCEMKKEKKEHRHGRGRGRGHGHGHDHHGKHRGRGRFDEITTDEFFQIIPGADNEDEEEDHSSDWLYELQEPEGHCNPNPCRNRGVCEEKERGKRKFKCHCEKPFKGKKCEKGPKRCRKGRCGRGECVLTSRPPYYECKCKEPFRPPNCERHSVCDPNPCHNGALCVKDGNDFDCACPTGFSGRYCQVGPNDCYTGDGESYRGNVSETDDGHECLFWNSHFLLESGTNPFEADENEDGLGPHNFCRNPDGSQMPWCFYRKGRRLWWDYCDVRHCDDPTDEPTTVKPTDQPGPTQPAPPPPPGPTEPAPPPPAPTEPVPPPPSTTSAQGTTPVPGPTPAPTNASDAQFRTCGMPQPKKAITRIFGGLKVAPGAIPWQASIQVRPKNSNLSYRHVCGGVLIESCWVLTAGHCIPTNQDMRVVLGSQDLSSEEPNEQALTVAEAIRHENYNEKPYAVYNDIGLLRLEDKNGECAKESQFVKTACLPDAPLPDGTECTISGWGATENSSYGSQHLLEANVLLINQEKCSERDVYGSSLDGGMLCAGHLQGGVDSCQGDSGGPLTCEENSTHEVYGLVSWGDQCGKKNKPGVYTRVTNYLDWIKSTMAAPLP